MQLIFETENPSLNISEKMSAVNEETFAEKPLLNGDSKEIIEQVNGKHESNGTGDVQNKKNILSNGDEIDSHKETENVILAEKASEVSSLVDKSDEIENFIASNKPLECLSATDTKEAKEVLNEDELLEGWSPATETEEAETTNTETEPLDETLRSEENKELIIEGDDAEEHMKEKKSAEGTNGAKDYTPAEEPAVTSMPAEKTKEAGDFITTKKSEDERVSEGEFKEASYFLPSQKPEDENLPVEKTKDFSSCISSEKSVDESLSTEEVKESENDMSKESSVTNCAAIEKIALAEQELNLRVKEKEQTVLETAEQKESDDPQSQDEEMTELEKDDKQPLESFSEATLDTESENPVQNQNGTHENAESDTWKVAQDKSESMDVDENDIKPCKNDVENISEHDVTQSINDMVDNIVQNFNDDDTADDSMDDIEMDNNGKVESIGASEEISVEKIDEIKNINTEGIDRNETRQLEPVNPKASNLDEEEHANMEGGQEPSINKIDGYITKKSATAENQETSLDDIPKTNQEPLEPKEVVTSPKPADTTILSPSKNNDVKNNKIIEASQNSTNEGMDKSNTAVNSTIEDNGDETKPVSSLDTPKENENKEIESDNPEVIELKSGDSSANSSFAKVENDIITLVTNGTEKDSDTPNKEAPETPEKDLHVASETVSEAKNIEPDKNTQKQNEDIKLISKQKDENEKTPEKAPIKSHTPIIKLSNTMDILSDDEDEPSNEVPKTDPENKLPESLEKQQTIDLIDDDDIMLIDEDPKEDKVKDPVEPSVEKPDEAQSKTEDKVAVAKCTENEISEAPADAHKDSTTKTGSEDVRDSDVAPQPEVDKPVESGPEKPEKSKPIIPPDFFKTYRKNLADMTRDDLEEFCILKIVESIIDRSNLNEIRTKLKAMAVNIEEYKKKAMMLTKQNRDLQVVLKSVQEEQKKATGKQPITPLKITRSVGMQVLMTDKSRRRVMLGPSTGPNASNNTQTNNKNVRTPNQSPRNTPQKVTNQIPVPRLVPAGMNVGKTLPVTQTNIAPKPAVVQNAVKNTSPAQKPEKRTHSRMQSQSSTLTVDLTDDEPPPKVATKSSPAPPVRLVNQQNLLAPRQQFSQQVNSPRKVYIPISINGPQAQTTRPGQTIMLKTVGQGPRPRGPNNNTTVVRAPQSAGQVRKIMGTRHPAPLPDAMKQYQPPNWKALPPAPDLKLSKVENGIVISWKIEGYQEDSYEEIASYQLYAYQETSAPASTSLWKKIGDVKALPLPMACTLTQFMAGYKYYFAVRAVDIRSRLGPFSLPGSILLLNKM